MSAALILALLQTAPPIQVSVHPARVLIERSRTMQEVQFDFRIENRSDDSVRVTAISLTAMDRAGKPWSIRFVDENGIDPGVETIIRRTVPARSAILIYNPFHTFAADLPLGRLRYGFTFAGREGEMTTAVEVDPIQYRQAVPLRLPLAGRILVYDGHDFYAHHRRVNTEHPLFKQAGFTTNPERYAHDLSLVDGAGRMYRGDGKRNEDWLSWGAPILAAAAGRVVAVENRMPDYDVGTPGGGIPLDSLLVRPASLMGNYVIVDHGGGMFSRMLHMQRGSVLVRVGQRVVQGQPVGKVGFSGSVSTVHLHYEIGSGPALDSEGLPAYFSGFHRIVGSSSRLEASGPINSGDIVER